MNALTASVIVGAVVLLSGCSTGETDSAASEQSEMAPSDAPIDVRVQAATVPGPIAGELQTALTDTMERFGVPGAFVAVTDPELGEWSAAAGVSDTATDEPMTTGLQWPIRSITKSFTVTVLLQLVDEGIVSLDDTIDGWVDGIPNGDRITLGQLADMTSGVPDYTGDAFVEDFSADPTAAFTREQLLDYVREGTPSAAPGSERRYINSSTVLLGEVIEQVEDRDFTDVLRDRILDPLGARRDRLSHRCGRLHRGSSHRVPARRGGPLGTAQQLHGVRHRGRDDLNRRGPVGLGSGTRRR